MTERDRQMIYKFLVWIFEKYNLKMLFDEEMDRYFKEFEAEQEVKK